MKENGYMNTHASKSFKKIYDEFVDKILNKYCGPDKAVCSLGCYNDDLAGQIDSEILVLVDIKFGPCKYRYIKDHPQASILPKINYEECPIEEFMLMVDYEEVFDVVIISTVIEHLSSKAREFILSNMTNILKPGGVFIITYPNAYSVNRLIGQQLGLLRHPYALGPHDIAIGHRIMYNYNDLFLIIQRELDMKIIEEIGIMFKPLSHAQMNRYFNEELDIFIEIGYDLGPRACSYIGGVFKK